MNITKRILTMLLALSLVLGLAACGGGSDKGGNKDKKTAKSNDYYLITDEGTIDDKSFNQGSFEGLKQYGEEVGKGANYLKPAGKGSQVYKQAIDQAVKKGAKVVVTPGFLFDQALGEAQKQYPDVKFVAVDFTPIFEYEKDDKGNEKKDAKGNPIPVYKATDNTVSITYKEEQSGFLAGYAAVKDGYTKLGFMGGVAVPAVIRYGFGFIAGANKAAEEMGVKVDVKFNYTGSFEAKPEIQTMASSWYKAGTEVIFSCGGGIAASVLKAAQDNGTKMIGVDVDQKDMGEEVITSAMKNLQKSVYDAVKSIAANKFQGGQTLVLGVEEKGVQISDDFSRFKQFTKEDYDKIYDMLVKNTDGITDSIPNDISNSNPTSFQNKMANVKIDFIQQ